MCGSAVLNLQSSSANRSLRSTELPLRVKKSIEGVLENEIRRSNLRTDYGGECTSNEFSPFCFEHGIKRELNFAYMLQQNCVVERD